jgi:hypothetical protein
MVSFSYLRGALDVSAAREMENAVWSVLSRSGVHRDNRETWSSVADVGEQGGGTLILRGSPALVARFAAEGGGAGGEKMAATRRRFLGSREARREMTRAPGPDLARFMARDFDIDGCRRGSWS